MTAPDSRDSVERVVAEIERVAHTLPLDRMTPLLKKWADRLQALARGPQQAGGEDVPEKVVAWMNEREAWRSPRAPSEPGTHALVLADDYAALQAEVARLNEQAEHLRSMYRNACKELALANEATLQARAALREAGRDAERYRWLRDTRNEDAVSSFISICNYGQEAYLLDGAELDAAIDAARAGGTKDA